MYMHMQLTQQININDTQSSIFTAYSVHRVLAVNIIATDNVHKQESRCHLSECIFMHQKVTDIFC